MKVATNHGMRRDIPWGEAVAEFRDKLKAESTCSFYIFKGTTYDSKTDRYVAKFETGSDVGRVFTVKCSTAAATFLMEHSERKGQWFLKIEDGVLTDVTLYDYNLI